MTSADRFTRCLPRILGVIAALIVTATLASTGLADPWSNFTAHRDAQYYRGSGVLHLNPTGYVTRASASFTDLNYGQDFSVEAVANVEPYASGGRWGFIAGKTSHLYDATSGFGLGTNQGFSPDFGQTLYAKVGDGSVGITVSANRLAQGLVHVAMTWNAGNKTLALYINGTAAGSASNGNLNTAGLINTYPFQLGGDSGYGSSQTLSRDILCVRLWNRLLSSADISALADNFAQTGGHEVPAGVSTASLLSEWKMFDTSDANGNTGTTHIKDSRGSNHLAITGSCSLLKASGTRQMVYPASGATNIPSAAFMEAGGGEANVGTGYVLPLHYSFQVDRVSTFNSADLKESGWVMHYGMWRPILKPGTKYYVRVKVRDSSPTPRISTWTSTRSFTTRATTMWYVRPGVYASGLDARKRPVPQSGIYGTQDGTSYINAWNGLGSIVWGPSGVQAGDDLYVCGLHVYQVNSNDWPTAQALEIIGESGLSDDYPITIRMDYASDLGKMWGIFKDNRTTVTWTGPDANGVYSTSNLPYGAVGEYTGTDYAIYDWESGTTWPDHYGASYRSPSPNSVAYVKTIDGGSPLGRVYSPDLGYRFSLGRNQYIRFYKAKLYGSIVSKDFFDTANPAWPMPAHVTFDHCDLRYVSNYSSSVLVLLKTGHDYWTFRDSELSHAGNGAIYTQGAQEGEAEGAKYLTVSHCLIHDVGRPRYPNADEHGVGVQGGEGNVIEYNEIHDTGEAITFWTYDQPMKNMTVRYNYIHDIHVAGSTGGKGIVVSGHNVYSVPGLRTGYEIYGNIIWNVGINKTAYWHGHGISSINKDPENIYNNIVVGAPNYGLYKWVGPSDPLTGIFSRNIVVNSPGDSGDYMYLKGTASPTNVTVASNLLYSSEGGTPSIYINPGQSGQPSNTVVANPLFAQFPIQGLSSFEIQAGSPVWALGWQRIPIENIGIRP